MAELSGREPHFIVTEPVETTQGKPKASRPLKKAGSAAYTSNQGGTMIQLRDLTGLEVVVDGYSVPYIVATETEDTIHVFLDHRFGIDTNREEIERWLPFLANAMAVAAGRTSHGEHSNIRNPHGEALAGYPTERIIGSPVEEVPA